VERRQRGAGWVTALSRAILDCIPLAPPALVMLVWHNRNVGNTGDWFNWMNKLLGLVGILRERWSLWDRAAAALLLALVMLGLVGRSVTLEPRARLAVLLLLLAYVVVPRVLIGSGYADIRLAAFVVAVALLGLQKPASWSAGLSKWVAAGALLFFAARLIVTTTAYAQIDRSWQSELAALDHIERGSRVLVLDDTLCREWGDDRLDHVSSFAVIRKDVFTNGQFTVAGALVDAKYRAGAPFVADPSHLMRRPPCPDRQKKIPAALKAMPGHFDYLWVVGVPRSQWPATPGLVPVWQGERGLLLRVRQPSGTPTAG
jgi:hypothetical protein